MLIGNHTVGADAPAYLVAEIGGNHNGSLETAKALITRAWNCGADAVKFQKRDPDICVPEHVKDQMRDTPWGTMRYLDYRHRMEFGQADYEEIAATCRRLQLDWFASVWDTASVGFMEQFKPPCYKIPSPCVTDWALLEAVKDTERPVILGLGMSTGIEITDALWVLDPGWASEIVVSQTTSAYPTEPCEANLAVIREYRQNSSRLIPGYSGHDVGYALTLAAVALGAKYIERHFTLDKKQWGSDHSISVTPDEFTAMRQDVRDIESAMGDGVKRVYPSEMRAMDKLRRYRTPEMVGAPTWPMS